MQSTAICRFLKCVTFQRVRHPCYSKQEIEARFSNLCPSEHGQERRYYESINNERSYTSILVTMCIYLAIITHNAIFSIYMLTLDEEPSKLNNTNNHTNNSRASHLTRYACLVTNCTRLSSDQSIGSLGEQMKRLPVFSLCHPKFGSTYGPVINLDTLGLLTTMTTVSLVSLLCIGLPIYELARPTGNDCIMYVVAPKTAISVIISRLHKFTVDMSKSYLHFKLQSFPACAPDTDQSLESYSGSGGAFDSRPGKMLDANYDVVLGIRSSNFNWLLGNVDRGRNNTSSSSAAQMSGCLPAVRTNWWRRKVANDIKLCVYGLVLTFVFYLALFVCTINRLREAKMERLREQVSFLESENCTIWTTATQERGRPTGNALSHVDMHWTAFSLFELIFGPLGSMLNLGGLLVYYYVVVLELDSWLLELSYQVKVAIELSEIRSSQVKLTTLDQDHQRKELCLERIRSKFIENVRFVFFVPYLKICTEQYDHQTSRGSHLASQVAYQELAVELAQNFGLSPYEKLIEKIYLNLRLFAESVQLCSKACGPVLVVSCIMCYSAALVAVLLVRLFGDDTRAPLLFAGFSLYWSNVYILVGAVFHAKAKQLNPLLWALISRIKVETKAGRANPKLSHLRMLLLRLLSLIERDGGIALRAFGIRVSYVNNIQLVIWTSTILVFALR